MAGTVSLVFFPSLACRVSNSEHRVRCLTLRSSGRPTALRAGRQAQGLRPILRLPSITQHRRAPLSSNVRQHVTSNCTTRRNTNTFRSMHSQKRRHANCILGELLCCSKAGGQQPVAGSSGSPSKPVLREQACGCACNRRLPPTVACMRPAHALPNPSLKLSPNGVSRWSPGAGPSAHFAPAAQHATPLAPA